MARCRRSVARNRAPLDGSKAACGGRIRRRRADVRCRGAVVRRRRPTRSGRRLAGCFRDAREPVGRALGRHARRAARVRHRARLRGPERSRRASARPGDGGWAGKLEARREDCAPVAGKSTLNRLELSRPVATRYQKISPRPGGDRGACSSTSSSRRTRGRPNRSSSTSTPPTTRCTANRKAGTSTAITIVTAFGELK